MNSFLALFALPARQLIGMAVAIAAVIALAVGAYIWFDTPDYRALYTNLADRDGGAVVQALNTMNVPYKYSDGGGAILVPSNLVYDTRLKLASQGLPRGGTAGFELMEQEKFGTTQFQEQVNYQRGLEGELARTIQSISSVQGARVHLAIPKASVFLRDQQKPSASVLLNLYPGKKLDRSQVSGIVHLVASSVPELVGSNVSIVDQNGNLLNTQSSVDGLDPAQLAYVQELEQSYTRRVVAILEPIMGPENVRAQVTADIDFSQTEQTAESYHPNVTPANSAIRSVQTSEETSSTNNGSNSGPIGVPGAASNQPTPPATAATPQAGATAATATSSNGGSNSSRKDNTTNYEVDKTVQLKRMPVGALKRLSVAILVNNRKIVDDKGATSFEAIPKEQLDQITALAREAVGFSQDRGDTLNVVNAPFTQAPVEAAANEPGILQNPDLIAKGLGYGKWVLFWLVLLYLVFGVLRPFMRSLLEQVAQQQQLTESQLVPITEGVPTQVRASYANQIESAKQIAASDPRIVANVVKGWVSANE